MIRLLKPLAYYREKYGTYLYGLNKLYLLMEKQHNRGQEAAGIGVLKMHTDPGNEYMFREREQGTGAIQDIFNRIYPMLADLHIDSMEPEQVEKYAPFVGNIYMGHLRYSTTGKSGISYVHPFLRRNNWRSRNLLLCGNFNMTNVDRIFAEIVESGQHPRLYSDTVVLLEQLGFALDKENHRIFRRYRDALREPELSHRIEDEIDIRRVLDDTARSWDGGFVICGITGSGEMFALRDAHGIRPAFYYADDEIVAVASERPVLQTVLDVPRATIRELTPGSAITVTKAGKTAVTDILGEQKNERCSFERIYFSRGSDADIYRERKALGRNLVPDILQSVNHDIDHTIFSFIPNTAEVAFIGMCEGLEVYNNDLKEKEILRLKDEGNLDPASLHKVMHSKIRVEKLAIKDIKLRTFIAEGESRNDLAAHVYDVTYGLVENNRDNVVVIDDSIVRGTTLRQSILAIIDRLHPRKVVVVSSAPQVRYPDYYGIDMSRLGEFIAFRAAVQLIKEAHLDYILDQTYRECKAQEGLPDIQLRNCVKAIYAPFTDKQITDKIAAMLTPSHMDAEVEIIYQSLEGLHKAVTGHPGDWYFSGDYPTPGGTRLVNRAFINFYEGHAEKRD